MTRRFSCLIFAFFVAMSAVPAQADTYTVVKRYPHDNMAFTQGLFVRDGKLFESTGLRGRSEIREVRLDDGVVLRRTALPPQYFGEGMVDNGDEIVSLTWTSGVGFRWRADDFAFIGAFSWPHEGWGLTRNAHSLIASDGSANLFLIDPATLFETGQISVTENGKPVRMLNELEWVDGAILANVWLTTRIVRIDPNSGVVLGAIDVAPLQREAAPDDGSSVANGIAWDAAKRRLFVTGKNWSYLYEIKWQREPAGERQRRRRSNPGADH